MRKLVWLVVALVGCNGDGEKDTDTDVDTDGGGEATGFTVASYNGGLAIGFVDGAESRVAAVADAAAGIDADVVCLQEIWLPDQISAVASAATASFPHQHFPDPLPSATTGDPACADGELDELIGCAETNCGDTCNDDLVGCVFDNCAIPFISLPKPCMACVMSEVGQAIDVVAGSCESVPEAYAYDDSFGIGILSKHPLKSVEQLTFESTTNRRAALHAVVDGPDGEVDVYCTHLTAILTGIPYPRDSGSWAQESGEQVDQLIQWVADTRTSTKLVVVAGDMNTGPAVGATITAEADENYQKFVAAGWTNPYLEAGPECTYCAANPLVDDESPSVLLDHVFRVDAAEFQSAVRILTQEIEAESCGETIPAALSDHYGVSVTF